MCAASAGWMPFVDHRKTDDGALTFAIAISRSLGACLLELVTLMYLLLTFEFELALSEQDVAVLVFVVLNSGNRVALLLFLLLVAHTLDFICSPQI